MTAADVTRSYFDAIARRDLDAMVALYSPELVVDMTTQGIHRGPDEMRKFFEDLFAAIPDSEMILERISGDEDVVFAQWRMRGTFTGGPLTGIDPTGAHLEIRGVDVIEVSGDLITRNTVYQDGMALARSLGMLPPLGSAAEKAMLAAFNLATKARQTMRDRFG